MIRIISVVLLGLALASAAQAMPFGPIHQPDAAFTQVREGCGPGQVRVDTLDAREQRLERCHFQKDQRESQFTERERGI